MCCKKSSQYEISAGNSVAVFSDDADADGYSDSDADADVDARVRQKRAGSLLFFSFLTCFSPRLLLPIRSAGII